MSSLLNASASFLLAAALPGAALAQDVPASEAAAQDADQAASAPANEEELALPPEEEAAPPAGEEPPTIRPSGGATPVTAAKREQRLHDVGVAVSVAGREEIDQTRVRDLTDLPALVPALRVTQLQDLAQTGFSIRGFGGTSDNPGIEPAVGVFVDGVYRSRGVAQIGDLPDVERIEVLRGPQSTLYGKNASAGVIALVTRAPSYTFHGSLEGGYGNQDGRILRGYVTGPLGDRLAASLAAGVNLRDGYVRDFGTGERSNERDRWFTRGQLLFQPGPTFSLRLIGDYDRIVESCCAAFALRRSGASDAIEALGGRISDPARPFADQAWSNFASSNRIDNWGLSAEAIYQVGPLAITSLTAWRESHVNTAQDSDFSSAGLIGTDSSDLDIGTFTQELRANLGFMDVFNVMLGGYYFRESVDSADSLLYGNQMRGYADLYSLGGVSALEAAIPALPAGTLFASGQGLTGRYAMRNRAWSVFGSLDFRFRKRLTLTLGVNYTRDAKDARGAASSSDVFSALDLASYGPAAQALAPLRFLPPFLGFPNRIESGRTRDGDWSWNARLAFDLTDRIRAYAGYTTGFRASSFNLSRDSRPLAADLPALGAAALLVPNLVAGSRFAGPEDVKVAEVGFKGDWGGFSAQVAAFRQMTLGFQSQISTGTGLALANAGKQSTWGIEFDGEARPVAGLAFNLSLVWLDPDYDSYANSPLGDLSGRVPAGIPRLSASLGGQWTHRLKGGDTLVLRANYHHESPVQVSDGLIGFIQRDAMGNVISYQSALDAARPYRREVSDVSGSLTYGFAGGLELSVWGRNLTNSRYLTAVFDTPFQPLSVSGYTNQPRTYGVSARFKW